LDFGFGFKLALVDFFLADDFFFVVAALDFLFDFDFFLPPPNALAQFSEYCFVAPLRKIVMLCLLGFIQMYEVDVGQNRN
jgi:hypothetical protein